MAAERTLEANVRDNTGSGPSNRVRQEGLVPGVCYGKDTDSISVAVDPDELRKVLDTPQGENTVFSLDVDGEGSFDNVMLRDYQINPVKRELQHVDLWVLDPNRVVTIDIPVSPQGTPEGEKEGGILQIVQPELEVECKVSDIPSALEVDVTHLGPGDTITADEIDLPEGVKATYDANFAVARIMMPREDVVGLLSPEEIAEMEAEEEEELEEGEVPEGEEAAEEGEGEEEEEGAAPGAAPPGA
jgi:large subunit ribosomal protein L25